MGNNEEELKLKKKALVGAILIMSIMILGFNFKYQMFEIFGEEYFIIISIFVWVFGFILLWPYINYLGNQNTPWNKFK